MSMCYMLSSRLLAPSALFFVFSLLFCGRNVLILSSVLDFSETQILVRHTCICLPVVFPASFRVTGYFCMIFTIVSGPNCVLAEFGQTDFLRFDSVCNLWRVSERLAWFLSLFLFPFHHILLFFCLSLFLLSSHFLLGLHGGEDIFSSLLVGIILTLNTSQSNHWCSCVFVLQFANIVKYGILLLLASRYQCV